MEISIIQLIKNSTNLFKKYKKQIIIPYLGILLISLIISGMSNALNDMNKEIIELIEIDPNLAISMAMEILSFSIIFLILTIIFGFISEMLEFSLYTPVHEAITKKSMSNWKKHFKKQFINVLKKIAVNILIAIPLIIGIVLLALGLFFNDLLIIFGILGIVCMIIYIILAFGTMFSSYYIVLKNKEIIESIRLSYNTIKNNLGICLRFILVWGVILIILSGLYPLLGLLIEETYILYIYLPISILLFSPILLISYIGLGNKLIK